MIKNGGRKVSSESLLCGLQNAALFCNFWKKASIRYKFMKKRFLLLGFPTAAKEVQHTCRIYSHVELNLHVFTFSHTGKVLVHSSMSLPEEFIIASCPVCVSIKACFGLQCMFISIYIIYIYHYAVFVSDTPHLPATSLASQL